MSGLRTLLLVVLGIAVPAALVAGVYLASAGPLANVPQVVAVPADKVAAPAAPTPPDSTTTEDVDPGKDDRPGKCDEKEHELDPECDPPRRGHRAAEPGSGQSGSGSSDSSSSGSGSGSNSGPGGSGDGDESGHGGSGDDD